MNFMTNTLISCDKETICLINSYLKYLNKYVYTRLFWAVSSVGRAIPF